MQWSLNFIQCCVSIYIYIHMYICFLELTLSQGLDFACVEVKVVVDKVGHDF